MTDKDLTALGDRMKELRLKAGYKSYEIFAYEKGLPRASYGKWEKGQNITYTNLIKVIRGLGVTVEEFFKGIK